MDTGPAISVTRAPRTAARSATRKPIVPEERLLRYRTGSIASLVGPAVTTTLTPSRSRRTKNASAAFAMSSGSDIRPTPSSPDATTP